ncbi:MAG TPA: hypothetical protein VI566_15955 [Xanthomonadales bacterium]|nr:hypothetical protein [Xanthomonadales bacterium]
MRKLLMVAILACGVFAAPTGAADEDEVNYLALAALMLRDGNYDRAMLALEQLDRTAEGVDLARYYTLLGMTHLRRNELEPARDALQQATDSGAVDAVVYIYLAQVYYQLEDYRQTLAALERAGAAVERVPSVYHMKAQCYWLLDNPILALTTLNQANEIFPEDTSFLRRKVFFLIDLGLFSQAIGYGQEYLTRTEGKLEDYIALGTALRASGDLDQAAVLLEQAQLSFPGSAEVRKALAHVYIGREQLGAAADILYQAALREPALLAEAAELYRRSGQLLRALTLNSQLSDQPAKLRQRLALYFELQNFEQAVALEPALRRVGLLADEELRYAVAYALFKVGDFPAAEKYLAELNRPDLFRKAAELRRAMGDCARDSWKCL